MDVSDEEDTGDANGATEEMSGSASDAEMEENDMVERSIPGLEDDNSSDEEGDTKRSKSAKPKAPVVKKEVTKTPAIDVSEVSEQKTWPVEGYYDSRHRDPSYWYYSHWNICFYVK